jgi:agmatinase
MITAHHPGDPLSLPFATGTGTFGGSAAAAKDLASAKALIIPVPYDATTTYLSGTRQGPAAIIRASQQLELFDEETCRELGDLGIATLEEVEVDAAGPMAMVARIRSLGERVLDAGLFPLMLGGEHLLSLGLIQAVAARAGALSILHLDAHADTRETYQGTKYSNACVMRLASRYGSLVSAGVRALSAEEYRWLRKGKLPVFYAGDMRRRPTRWQEEILAHLGPKVYLTIDLDVFDPAEMPAVGTPEPGGLHWYDILDLVRLVCERKRLVGADVMELCPHAGNVAPDFLAAKLVFKILAYRSSGPSP